MSSDHETNQSNQLNLNINDVEDADITIGDIHIGGNISAGGDVNQTTIEGDQYVTHGLTVEQVEALFVTLKSEALPVVWDGRNPYLGLKSFHESDAEFFFGRETLVDELLERVKQTNFIAIAGPSGSGKSSAARAGLFHALRSDRLPKSRNWLLATMKPAGKPIEQLARAFERVTKSAAGGDAIRQDPQSFLRHVDMHLSDDPDQRFVLLVDQFEELFTQVKDLGRRAAFIKMLTSAVQAADSRLTVILSLRSDFISHCAVYPDLRQLMSQQFQLVGAMTPTELAKAMTLPALAVGAGIDSALVAQITTDMKGEPGTLPLMSFALHELFEKEKSRPGEPMDITLREYLAIGGIESALERHAENVFAEFTAEQRDLAKNLFSRLVEIGQGRVDTRRIAPLAELVPAEQTQSDVTTIINRLAQADTRLITTSGSLGADQDGQEATVTIAHEKLIDAWPWLRQLVDENRELIALQNQISRDAQEWAEQQDDGYLYRGGRLAQVEERLADLPALDGQSRAFIEAGIGAREAAIQEAEAQRKRELEQQQELAASQRLRAEEAEAASHLLRQRRNVAFGAAGLAVALAVVAFVFFGQANESAQVAERNAATAVAAQSESDVNAALAAANEATAIFNAAEAAQNEERAVSSAEDAVRSAATAEAALAQANAQATIAAENLDVAVSRQLASASSSQLARREVPELPMLLAVEALYADDTAEAFISLSDALGTAGQPLRTWHQNSEAAFAAWDAQQTRLMLDLGDGLIQLVDARDGTVLGNLAHDSAVSAAAWGPSGAYIAVATEDFSVHVWDAATLTKLAAWQHEDTVLQIIWNKDGSQLITAGWGETIIAWDVANNQELSRWVEPSTRLIVWSEDETQAGTAGFGGSDLVIWDIDSGRDIIRVVSEGDQFVHALDWEGDSLIALRDGAADNEVQIFDVTNGVELSALTYEAPPSAEPFDVQEAVWNDARTQVAVSTDLGTVILSDVASGAVIVQSELDSWISQMTWSPDQTHFVATSAVDTVQIFDASTGFAFPRFNPRGTISDMTWHEDERMLLTVNNSGVRVWNVKDGEELLSLPHLNALFAIWADEDEIWTASGEMVRFWDTRIGSEAIRVPHLSWNYQAQWGADQTKLLTVRDSLATIWDSHTGAVLQDFEHIESIDRAFWNRDETRILTLGERGTAVHLWDVETGMNVADIVWENDIQQVKWSPDGSQLLIVDGYTLAIWDIATERIAVEVPIEDPDVSNYVSQALWSDDGARVLVQSSIVTVVDDLAGANYFTIDPNSEIDRVIWNQDGSRIVVLIDDGHSEIWDGTTGRMIARNAHGDIARLFRFNPDQTAFVTREGFGLLQVWDIDTGAELMRLEQEDIVFDAVWTEDGSRLLTNSADRTARIWDLSGETAVEQHRFIHLEEVLEVRWSADESEILTLDSTHLHRWDVATGDELVRWPVGDNRTILDWDDTGSRVLMDGSDQTVGIFILDRDRVIEHACTQMPRNMTADEWLRFMDGVAYRPTCRNLPLPVVEGER